MEINLSEDNKSLLISSSDNFYTVKAIAFKNFKELCDYQKELLSIFFKYGGHIQYTLTDTKCVNIIKKINKLLFKEDELISLIDDLNVNDIINLYFTTNEINSEEGFRKLTKKIDEDEVEKLNLKPSLISILNGMDFFSAVNYALEKWKVEQKKKEENQG